MNIRYYILAERDSEGAQAIIEYYFFCKNGCCTGYRAYVMTVISEICTIP